MEINVASDRRVKTSRLLHEGVGSFLTIGMLGGQQTPEGPPVRVVFRYPCGFSLFSLTSLGG